jgi:hypothetical protein
VGALSSNILLISSEAIKTVSVNINFVNFVTIVNNRRTGESVLTFPTKRQFIDSTYLDRTYPLNRAADNALMTPCSSRWVARSMRRQDRKIWRDILCCTNNMQASDHGLRSTTLFHPKVLAGNVQKANSTGTSTVCFELQISSRSTRSSCPFSQP